MSIFPPRAPSGVPGSRGADGALLPAILDDIRATLRMSWVDPGMRSVSDYPEFFAAAWSATRPNVTRSFGAAAERLRGLAHSAFDGVPPAADHTSWIDRHLAPVERDRLVRTVHALNASGPKVLLVVQAWTFLARRRRIPGTGREEAPARRGIPSWQDTASAMPRLISEETEVVLNDVAARLEAPVVPQSLRALAAWPAYLEHAGRDVQKAARTPAWRGATGALRRGAVECLSWLPHPMELQWDVLGRRGVSESSREALAHHVTRLAAAMPTDILIAHHVWRALGSPEGPTEG